MKTRLQSLIGSTLCFALMGSSVVLTACDDDEIAAGVVGAVIGAGVATAIDHNYDDDRRNCRPIVRTVCTNRYDYYGRNYRDCREVRDRCYRNDRNRSDVGAVEASFLARGAQEAAVSARARAEEQGLTTADFAKEYGLSFEAADAFFNALDRADRGDAAPLRELGLSDEDIQLLGQFKQPTEAGIDALAQRLDQRPDITNGMLNRIRGWAISERTRICQKPEFKKTDQEKKLCNET